MATETKAVPTDKVIENQADVTKEEKKGSPETNSANEVQAKLKSINIKLPEDLHRQLKAKSALEGVSTANVVRRLIDGFIKQA